MDEHGTVEVRRAIRRIRQAVDQLEKRLSSDDLATAAGAAAELRFVVGEMQARLDHAVHTSFTSRYDSYLSRARQRLALNRPVWALVAEALDRFGATARPREIAAFVEAVSARHIPARAFSSLRRDERRSWERRGRSVFVVPALDATAFTPARGRVCLSTWPIERRLLTPLAERADALTAVVRLARWLLTDEAVVPPGTASLIHGWAETAIGHSMTAADLHDIAEAAAEIVNEVATQVRAEREAAAKRARTLLRGTTSFGVLSLARWRENRPWHDREKATVIRLPLAKLRGRAPERSHDVSRLQSYAETSICPTAAVAFAAGIDTEKFLDGTDLTIPYGQAPQAIRRGSQFEAALKADDYRRLIQTLRPESIFPKLIRRS